MKFNKRIIVIDDNSDIHEDYKIILQPNSKSDEISVLESFIDESANSFSNAEKLYRFDVDFALQGESGFNMIKTAKESEQPYAVAFIDMRMPPGWDGLETSKRIREIDKNIEIVIVTAFTDVPRYELEREILPKDKLLYLKKPFNVEEIQQIAINLTNKYHLYRKIELYNQSLKRLIKDMKKIKGVFTKDYFIILRSILNHVLDYVETDSGFLALIQKDKIEHLITVGSKKIAYNHEEMISEIKKVKSPQNKKLYILDKEFVVFPLTESDHEGNEVYIFAIRANEDIKNNDEIMLILIETLQDIFSNLVFQKKLFESQRLASVGLAANKIIHDLKNPLSAISGFSDLINFEIKNIEDQKLRKNLEEYSNLIKIAKENMMDNVQSILNFSSGKIELNVSEENLSEVLEQYINDLRILFDNEDITLLTEFDHSIIANIDISQMRRVISNLVSNAIQALNTVNHNEKIIKIMSFKEKNNAKITICDNGPGISEKIKETMFDPFITVGHHKGSGLGLAIVKQIIEMHNGNIKFQSRKGKTRFEITIPITNE